MKLMKFMTIQDLRVAAEKERARRRKNAWVEVVDGEKYLRINAAPGYIYDIPFSRLRTAEQVLDWIHQVCVDKVWGKKKAGDVLCAIFDEVIPTSMWSGKG